MGPHEIEKHLLGKGHCHSDNAAAYRMGKDFLATPDMREVQYP